MYLQYSVLTRQQKTNWGSLNGVKKKYKKPFTLSDYDELPDLVTAVILAFSKFLSFLIDQMNQSSHLHCCFFYVDVSTIVQ